MGSPRQLMHTDSTSSGTHLSLESCFKMRCCAPGLEEYSSPDDSIQVPCRLLRRSSGASCAVYVCQWREVSIRTSHSPR